MQYKKASSIKAIIRLLIYLSLSTLSSITVESLNGTKVIVPQERQLIFVGSTKKSYDQLKGWYELCKKNPSIIDRTQILVLPVFEGFLSRKGVRNAVHLFLKTAVPKGHKGRVIPIYEEASEYKIFSKFLDSQHNLSVVLLGNGSEPLWKTTGEVTEQKAASLKAILDS